MVHRELLYWKMDNIKKKETPRKLNELYTKSLMKMRL